MATELASKFQLNGAWVIRTECRSCHVEIHSACGDEEPSDRLVTLAAATRRTCESCLSTMEMSEQAARDRRLTYELVEKSGIPAAVRGYQFAEMSRDGGRRDRAVEACVEWANGRLERPGIYLFGSPGVGKTRLAATAAWARIDQQRPIRWCSVVTLMTNLSRTFADTERRKALSILSGTDALVLDDLDKVNPSEFGKQQIFAALDERVQAGAPLLVTANARLSEIGERYGDHVMSRLAGHCLVFELDGEDRRLFDEGGGS